ncbi:transcription initiation factor IIB 2 [archaeon SCG-AAA382B04]|nr:transcription initiation factor IIB 2 [archaeon SCG-AAA382B04]
MTEDESKKCPECGGKLVKEENELRCEDCGLVLEEDYIDWGPEWRAFSSEERDEKARAGPPSTVKRHDKGLSTEIGFRDRYGKELDPEKRNLFSRLRKWHSQSKRSTGKEKSLSEGLQEIGRMSGQISLPNSVQKVASVIYKRASKENLIRGRSIEAIAAAALYIATRFFEIPRTLDEFVEVSRINRIEVARAERHLVENLGIPLKPVDPELFIPKLKSKIGFDADVEKESMRIIEKARKRQIISGKSPISISAASIYIAGKNLDRKITQDQISDASDISKVTIRNRYKELVDKLGIKL